MMNRTFQADARRGDFDDHLSFLMQEAIRLHGIGEKADRTRKRATARYQRCYQEMLQIVDEMKKTRTASERLFG